MTKHLNQQKKRGPQGKTTDYKKLDSPAPFWVSRCRNANETQSVARGMLPNLCMPSSNHLLDFHVRYISRDNQPIGPSPTINQKDTNQTYSSRREVNIKQQNNFKHAWNPHHLHPSEIRGTESESVWDYGQNLRYFGEPTFFFGKACIHRQLLG